jgi:hypothetical protein
VKPAPVFAAGLAAIAILAGLWGLLRIEEMTAAAARIERRLEGLEERLSRIEGSLPSEGGPHRAGVPAGQPAAGPRSADRPAATGTPSGQVLQRIEERLAAIEARLNSDSKVIDAPIFTYTIPEVESPDFTATLTARARRVDLDGKIRVAWTLSPDRDRSGRGDWIGLYESGAENGSYKSYQYATGQSSGELEFEAPGAPGEYEFRYLNAASLAIGNPSRPFTVTAGFTVALNAWPDRLAAGAKVTVSWAIYGATDRRGRGDWIGLFAPGAENGSYQMYKMAGGEPAGQVEFEAIEKPGDYELRYLTGGNFPIGQPFVLSVLPAEK